MGAVSIDERVDTLAIVLTESQVGPRPPVGKGYWGPWVGHVDDAEIAQMIGLASLGERHG